MFSSRLHELISSVVQDRPSEARVAEFAHLSRKIALVQLRRKVAAGRLNADYFRIPLDDIAWDSIADLLRQDEDGKLVQIASYFESLSYASASEEHLLAHLRRLIFAKVNQSLFRMHNELDPSLGRVLRNMKLALHALQSFHLVERFGEQWLAPVACETLEHLPAMETEALQLTIREQTAGSDRIPQLLAKLGSYLRTQSAHSRMVPLMSVAFALRCVHAGDGDGKEEPSTVERTLFVEDATALIAGACRSLMKEHAKKYVEKKEVPREVFAKYFEVIERNLHQRIIGHDGDAFSFYEGLRGLMPELTREEYAATHKSRLEYLARLSYDEAVKELKKHL